MKYEVLEWLSELEEARGVGPDGDSGTCEETGGIYNTIMWGINIDRVAFPIMNDWDMLNRNLRTVLFDDEDTAWNAWRAAFQCYLKDRKGMIYWRTRPALIATGNGCTFVRARVLVAENLGSNKAHKEDRGKAEVVVSVGS